jgi:streptogramin lyase
MHRLSGRNKRIRAGAAGPGHARRRRLVCEELEPRLVPAVFVDNPFVREVHGALQSTDITTGPDGNLWSTGSGGTIDKLNPATDAITVYPVSSTNGEPWEITTGPDGRLWFTDLGANEIGAVDPATGAISEFALSPGGGPWGITTGPDGNIWFTTYSGSKIGEINPKTGAISEFSVGSDVFPAGITTGPDGQLWFTDLSGHIGEMDPATHAVRLFPLPDSAYATSIVTGPDGNLWFMAGHEIGEINPTTHVIAEFTVGLLPLPNDGEPVNRLAVGPDGNIWFTNASENEVGEINPATHTIQQYAVPTFQTWPLGITAGSDGNVWLSESAAQGIGEVVLDPSVKGPVTPNVSVNPISISVGTALGNSQLSGTATVTVNGQTVPVAGTFAYTIAAGAVLYAGQGQVEAVTFTPTDTTDYATVVATVTINAGPTAPSPSSPAQTIADPHAPYAGSQQQFGDFLAISGTEILVGSPGSYAYLYNTSGQLLQTFQNPDPTSDGFGVSVALSGTNVLIGATAGADGQGAAYLYNTDGQLLRTFHDPNGTYTGFGYAVAVSGSMVLIGAAGGYTPEDVPHPGAAYLFDTAGDLLETFSDPNSSIYSEFGSSVALSANNVLVGAQGASGAGAAYLYDTSGQLVQTLSVPAGPFFGAAVALSGTNILVGAPANNGDRGEAFLFDTSGHSLQTFYDPDGTSGQQFGNAVALSGDYVLVGAYAQDLNYPSDPRYPGAAFLFTTSGQLVQVFRDPKTVRGDNFGGAVAIAGGKVVVAADGSPGGTTRDVYVYNAPAVSGTVSALAGDNQHAVVGMPFGTSLEVQVTDSSGNPVAGSSVTFTVNTGLNGAAATFAGSGSVNVTSNSQGIAIAPALTANAIAGDFSVSATAGSSSGALFALTNDTGLPSAIVAGGRSSQVAPLGFPYAFPLQAQVTDADGNPVAGVPVTFTAPSSGPSGTFSGSTTVATDAQGMATAPAFTANSVQGTFVVTATANGIAGTVDFTLTNLAAPIAPAHTFQAGGTIPDGFGWAMALSGTNVLLGTRDVAYLYNTAGQLLQTFSDPNGTNLGFGGAVAISGNSVLVGAYYDGANHGGSAYLFDTSGKLLQTFEDPVGATDDNFGTLVALSGSYVLIGARNSGTGFDGAYLYNRSGQLLHTFTQDRHAAEVWGNAMAMLGTNVLLGSQAADNLAGTANLYDVSGQLLHTFQDPAGSGADFFGTSVALSTGYVLVGAPGNAGAAYLFNTSGQLLQTFQDPDKVNGEYFGSSVAIYGNDDLIGAAAENGTPGMAYLFDTSGHLLQSFEDPDGSSNHWFGSAVALSATNALVGATAGYTDFPGADYLYNVSTAQPPPELSALFGNNETTIVGTTFGTLLEAQVTDASGNPLSGYSVTFTVNNASTGAGAAFGGNTVVTVTTNSEGVAIAPVLTADTVAGSFSVAATTNGASATFLLTNVSGAPAKVTVVGGNGQSTAINSIFGTLLQVEVTDAYGNAVAGVAVTFSAPQSGPSGTFNAVTTVPTNALGIATAPAFTANGMAGTFAVTAAVAGVPAPARFTLTNTRKRTWMTVVGQQLTELYREFRPYYNAREVSSFVPSHDLAALNVANGRVAIMVRAFVDTSSEIVELGGQVTAVRYLPVAVGMPGIEVDAIFPIIKLPALGNLADVVIVSAQDRVGAPGRIAPSITANHQDRTVLPGRK